MERLKKKAILGKDGGGEGLGAERMRWVCRNPAWREENTPGRKEQEEQRMLRCQEGVWL